MGAEIMLLGDPAIRGERKIYLEAKGVARK